MATKKVISVERGRILRAELVGDHDRQAAENLILRVHEEPLAVVAGVRGTGAFLQHLMFLVSVALCPLRGNLSE